jgi:hypothetical protein
MTGVVEVLANVFYSTTQNSHLLLTSTNNVNKKETQTGTTNVVPAVLFVHDGVVAMFDAIAALPLWNADDWHLN